MPGAVAKSLLVLNEGALSIACWLREKKRGEGAADRVGMASMGNTPQRSF